MEKSIQLGVYREIEDRSMFMNPIQNLGIKKARCNRYVPNSEKNDTQDLCHCGRKLEEHHVSVIDSYRKYGAENGEKWDADDKSNRYVTEDGFTDAYGEIKFINNNENVAKYIRVHYKTEISKIVQLLFNYWKLKPPKLLISVTGGAQKFSLKPRLRDAFRRGLVKAALSTSAWISTGGFNVGVMKHVGEAIRKHSSLNPNDKIVVLGIASWTMVLHNEKLIRDPDDYSELKLIEYTSNTKNEKERKQPLDPNHSHFILVDNSKISFGGEIDFRAALESAISKGRSENKNAVTNDIPIVVLVLEGGPGTLKTVYESVKNGTPCVFVEGSGKCADIFAYALKYLKEKEKETKDVMVRLDSKLENEIKFQIRNMWPTVNVDKAYDQIEKTLSYTHLLSAFSLGSGDYAYDIDVAILTSLLKAKKENYIAQLKLALRWNRVDIARDYIFNEDIKWESKQIDEIMYHAIMDNRVEFVNLLLQNGFNLNMFLTNRCLLKLYNDAFTNKKDKSISYLNLMRDRKKLLEARNYDFYEIGKIIQTLVEDLYEPYFTKSPFKNINLTMALVETNEIGKVHSHMERQVYGVTATIHSDLNLDEKCENPEHELFMLSILLIRPAMAKVFWREGSNEIFLALLTTKIYKTLATINDEEAKSLNSYADDFEMMALNVLDDCYKRDETKAELLLLKEIQQFGKLTSLQVAISANDLTFVSHPCVQGLLTKLWYNKIMSDTPKPIIGLSILFPPIAPVLIEYREDRRLRLTSNENAKKSDELDKTTDISDDTLNRRMKNANEIGFVDTGKKLSYFEKVYFFVKAPVVKFLYNQISYILFLILFSYVMLCDFYPIPRPEDPEDAKRKYREENSDAGEDFTLVISIPEIVLIFWVTMHLFDQIRQFLETDAKVLRARIRIYFYNFWNTVEISALVLYYLGLILRFIPNNHETYTAARVIFCIDLIFWYLKSLSYYSVIRNLGPKLVMINRMMYELMYFVFIVIVFLFAFGVSTQALMFHNQELDSELLKQVFFPSYFVIGGEYYTWDDILEADDCVQNNNDTSVDLDIYTQEDCPEKRGAQVAMAIYVGYLILLNILLVNLLIAIFSYTFEQVQNETDKIWKFQRYSLIYEYFHKPLLAPPFSIFSYFISALRLILRPIRKTCCKSIKSGERNLLKRFFYFLSKDWKTGFRAQFDASESLLLTKWEDIISDEYLHMEEAQSKETIDYKLQIALDRVEMLNRKFDEIIDKRDDLQVQVEKCEEKIDKVLEILTKNFTNKPSNLVLNVKPKQENSSDQDYIPVNQSSTSQIDTILSPSNINTLTAVEMDDSKLKINEILNQKSRTLHYPKSNITRTFVPDNKVPWSVQWLNYNPVEYTAKAVLSNPNADNNIFAYPINVRPEIAHNDIDERYKVDRRSCLGKYQLIDGLPLNPIGRTGITGRGLLNFWGPNHAIEAIFTRWKKDQNGRYLTDNNNMKILQFIIIEKSIQLRDWHLPHVMLERTNKKESILMQNLLTQVFEKESLEVKENYEKLRNILNNGEIIDKYYKDSQRNTDNAWIETDVVNYHDEIGDLFTKLPLKSGEDTANSKWKTFSKNIQFESQDDWLHLSKISSMRHASFNF